MINSDREDELYRYIIAKADALSCIVHAIGGVEDHIHLIVSIPPTLAIAKRCCEAQIADFVKKIKGSSAHYLNQFLSSSLDKFGWQEGYGVFSLGSKQLEQAVEYVNNQKAHHLNGTAIASLEQATHQNDSPRRWSSS